MKRRQPEPTEKHVLDRITDREGDRLRVDVMPDTLFLEPEMKGGGVGTIIALDRPGVGRLLRLCQAFLGVKPKHGMEVPVSITADTSEAKAAVDELTGAVGALVTQAEKLSGLSLPRLGGTATVSNMASQDPEACWRTIRDVLETVKSGRLTVAQAAVVLRTAVTLISNEEAEALLAPHAKEQVPPTPTANAGKAPGAPEQWDTKGYPMPPGFAYPAEWPKMEPKEQKRHWWFLKSGGSMSDMSTEEDLQQFILNGGTHRKPVGYKIAVHVNVSGEDVLVTIDPGNTIHHLKRVALDASKHREASGMDWKVFDGAGLVRRDHEIIQDVLGNLRAEEWSLTMRKPGDIGYR